jgi:hypothetical protein
LTPLIFQSVLKLFTEKVLTLTFAIYENGAELAIAKKGSIKKELKLQDSSYLLFSFLLLQKTYTYTYISALIFGFM